MSTSVNTKSTSYPSYKSLKCRTWNRNTVIKVSETFENPGRLFYTCLDHGIQKWCAPINYEPTGGDAGDIESAEAAITPTGRVFPNLQAPNIGFGGISAYKVKVLDVVIENVLTIFVVIYLKNWMSDVFE